MEFSKKSSAFTLAEVLITLGIIGVVAAMTMPTLINQTNGAQYKAAYKKALSAISQGVTLNVALDDISFADTVKGKTGETACSDTNCTGTTIAKLINDRMNVVSMTKPADYTIPQITAGHKCTAAEVTETTGPCAGKTADQVVQATTVTPDTYLFFNDGSMFAFDAANAYSCTKAIETETETNKNKICLGVIDVNGAKGPNKVVTCDETNTGDANASKVCTIKSPTDIYPVEFYDQTILPASDAAKAVLYGK